MSLAANSIDALLAYAHYASLLIMASFLGAEAMLLRAQPGPATFKSLSRADIGYFIAAMLTLASGLGRLFYGAKGVAFYSGNPLLYVKITLFAIIGLVSIKPTLRFIRWRNAAASDETFQPDGKDLSTVRRVVFLELHLLALIPLAAVFMARGIGN